MVIVTNIRTIMRFLIYLAFIVFSVANAGDIHKWIDEEGNVQVLGPTALIDEQARASKKVIVTVEKIIDSSEIIRRPELTVIPSFIVDVIVEVSFGSHPTAMHAYYDYDIEHLEHVLQQSKTQKTLDNYLDEFVYEVNDHSEYLALIGGKDKQKQLRERATW